MRQFLNLRSRSGLPLACLSLAAIVLVLSTQGVDAQNSLGIGRPEQAIRPEGPLAGVLFWIQEQQQAFYRLLTGELKGMRADSSHFWMLSALSFAYGVFHAAGPGHGKAVISSYMLANEMAARRGIVLAFASALVQAVTAIALIGVVFLFLRQLGIRQDSATRWLEIASYAGVTALGAWLLWQKLLSGLVRRLLTAPSAPMLAGATAGHAHAEVHIHREAHVPHHGQAHEHGHARGHEGHHHHHGHAHDHVHGPDCGCGHSHAPDPGLLQSARLDLRQAWTAILAVGLRPCSGALIVLTFSFLYGLHMAGIAATFAMALGTGLTVAVLAAMAVWAKDLAIRIGGAAERGVAIHRMIEVTGALLIFLLGATLLSAAWIS